MPTEPGPIRTRLAGKRTAPAGGMKIPAAGTPETALLLSTAKNTPSTAEDIGCNRFQLIDSMQGCLFPAAIEEETI